MRLISLLATCLLLGVLLGAESQNPTWDYAQDILSDTKDWVQQQAVVGYESLQAGLGVSLGLCWRSGVSSGTVALPWRLVFLLHLSAGAHLQNQRALPLLWRTGWIAELDGSVRSNDCSSVCQS